jgi:hypothetical protein
MIGRFIEDVIDEKRAELDALDQSFRIMGWGQMAQNQRQKEKVQRELEDLERRLATGQYTRRPC